MMIFSVVLIALAGINARFLFLDIKGGM